MRVPFFPQWHECILAAIPTGGGLGPALNSAPIVTIVIVRKANQWSWSAASWSTAACSRTYFSTQIKLYIGNYRGPNSIIGFNRILAINLSTFLFFGGLRLHTRDHSIEFNRGGCKKKAPGKSPNCNRNFAAIFIGCYFFSPNWADNLGAIFPTINFYTRSKLEAVDGRGSEKPNEVVDADRSEVHVMHTRAHTIDGFTSILIFVSWVARSDDPHPLLDFGGFRLYVYWALWTSVSPRLIIPFQDLLNLKAVHFVRGTMLVGLSPVLSSA